jgi:hypothetical protein
MLAGCDWREVTMQFTRREEKVVRPLLRKDAEGQDAVSNLLFLAGAFVLGTGIVMIWAGLGRDYGAGLFFAVAGLIVIEHAWNRRDRHTIARILQKYDRALQRVSGVEDEEVTR